MRSSNEAYISGPQPANGIDLTLCVVSVCPCEYERLGYMCRMTVVLQTNLKDSFIFLCQQKFSLQTFDRLGGLPATFFCRMILNCKISFNIMYTYKQKPFIQITVIFSMRDQMVKTAPKPQGNI